jgi:TRAP-type C4-dicarboxylate transport system substrate-binding protein
MKLKPERLRKQLSGRGSMKKRGFLTIAGCIGLVFILVTPTIAQVIKMNLATQDPSTAWGMVHATKPWVKQVEEATKRKVKIDVYYAQTLVKGRDIWNAVKTGVTDIGWCFHGYWPNMTPLSEVITLPSLPFRTAEKMSEVLWKLYEKYPEIQKEYRDVHLLMLWTSHPYILISTKKQIKTLEDIKGMKIRVTGGPPTEQMKALGAVPVLIPMPDAYMALEKGVVDGMAAPWEPILGQRLYEVVRYYTIVPLSAVFFSMSMNRQRWDSLPKDIQEAITSVSGLKGSKFWGRNYFDTPEAAVIDAVRKAGYPMIRYTVPPEEVERWSKLAGYPIWKEWVKKMETNGYPMALQILNSTVEMLKH